MTIPVYSTCGDLGGQGGGQGEHPTLCRCRPCPRGRGRGVPVPPRRSVRALGKHSAFHSKQAPRGAALARSRGKHEHGNEGAPGDKSTVSTAATPHPRAPRTPRVPPNPPEGRTVAAMYCTVPQSRTRLLKRRSRYWGQGRGPCRGRPLGPKPRGGMQPPGPHLVGAGEPQAVEDGQEEVGGEQGVEQLPQAHPEEFGAVAVRLGRHPQHLDGRHEAGREREPHRHRRHPSPPREEILRGLLAALGEAVEEPDARGHQQHQPEDPVVPEAEGEGLRHPHLQALRWGQRGGCRGGGQPPLGTCRHRGTQNEDGDARPGQGTAVPVRPGAAKLQREKTWGNYRGLRQA